MPHHTIEYIIMFPLLFTQLLLFPFLVNVMVSSLQYSQRQDSLEYLADYLGSMIRKLYFYANLEDISPGTITQKSPLPPTIDGKSFTAIGSLVIPSNPDLGRTLHISLKIDELGNTATTEVILGSNVDWRSSIFRSDSFDASINAQKFPDDTILLFFGGGG